MVAAGDRLLRVLVDGPSRGAPVNGFSREVVRRSDGEGQWRSAEMRGGGGGVGRVAAGWAERNKFKREEDNKSCCGKQL